MVIVRVLWSGLERYPCAGPAELQLCDAEAVTKVSLQSRGTPGWGKTDTLGRSRRQHVCLVPSSRCSSSSTRHPMRAHARTPAGLKAHRPLRF
ncbi:hypothetical protein FKM82_019677 [Ascaphus truei]